ncbi:MAG: ankyrin repeat domain-containing protein [Gammaproteobacteria bacterium]|nr:ankyrin repeat domain-containing protein [Gammaproteobacteria bacterium]
MSSENIEMLVQLATLGQIRALKELLCAHRDINVNLKNEDGNLAVVEAARRNNPEMVRLLVQYGADLSAKDAMGREVKGWAKKYNNEEILSLFNQKSFENDQMETKIDKNKVNNGKSSPPIVSCK